MLERYNEIMNISRPHYADLPQMSASDRAAQFSPFAALVGYDEAVDETARLTQDRIELTEDEQNALNANLSRVLDLLEDYLPTVTVTYFVPDERKSGGRYVNKTGEVRIYDSGENALVFTDGVHIAVNDMLSVVTQ